MCQECVTDICLVFDRLVAGYYQDHPAPREDEHKRDKYMQMDVRNAPQVAADFGTLKELIDRAPGINFQPWEFKTELAKRSGFGEQIEAWANADKIPNGLARKIILSCAEDILIERGARPERSMKEAA
jgi:hypothetical protein